MMSDWHTIPLGKVVTFQRGYDLPTRVRKEGPIPIVSSAGVIDYHNALMVAPPGVVTGRYGTIGEVFFITEAFWPLNTTLYVRDFHGNDPSFVYYLLKRFDFRSFSGKSGVPGVNRNDLHAESVTLPLDVEEQRAIATALSDVDALLTALDRLIAKKRDLKQAAMQQLLTGQTRLPGEWVVKAGYKQTEVGVIPEDWEIKDLAALCSEPMQNGLFYQPARKGTGIKLINVGDLYKSSPIDSNSLELFNASKTEKERFKVEDGDLFFTRSSVVPSGIAHCNIYNSTQPESVVFDSHLIRLKPDRSVVEPSYLFRFCMTSIARTYLISRAKTGTMTTIDQGVLGKCPTLLPSLPEQTAIATVLADMDAELAALEQRRAKTRLLKQAMMQELLTGRTRLLG